SISTADPNRSIVALRGSLLIFNDGTSEPLKRMLRTGGMITPLVESLGVPISVVVHGGFVYSSSGCTVFKTSLDGTSTTVLVRSAACPANASGYLAVDDVNAYYATYASNTWTIRKVPI